MDQSDEFWISKCFALAERGKGAVSPNPLVGAIIVKNGKKISEGFHQRFGGPHAEINAINQALSKGKKISGSTLYLNLEPCFHFGKTPPCVDTILEHQISRVVISTKDPNPLVAGKSIKKLEKAGVKCSIGILQHEAERLNEKFFSFIKTGKPFVALKAAQTIDGFIAKADGTSKWITNARSRKYVHQLRTEYDAVIIGARTVNLDNPELTVRAVKGKNPIRIVIDGKLSVRVNTKIFNSKAPTIVYTTSSQSTVQQKKIRNLEKKGVVVVQLEGKAGVLKIDNIINDLGKHQISSVLIEGGQHILSEFINSQIARKIYLFSAPKKFGTGLKTFGNILNSFVLTKSKDKKFGTDILEEFYLNYNG